MRILVLGSSNSIGQTSYIAHLGRMPGFEITNRSIGASSTTAGLFSALGVGVKNHDFSIVDYEINEQGSMNYGLKSEEDVRRDIRAQIFLLRKDAVTPIVAIMPTTRGRDRATRAEELHIEACREVGTPYFNIAELFRLAHRRGAAWAPMMRDDFHMSADTTPVVSEILARALKNFHEAPQISQEWKGDITPVRIIQAAPLVTPERRKWRQSNHRSAWCAILREGKRMILPIGANERLLGVLINSGCLGGKIIFRADGREIVKNFTIYFGSQKAGWFISVMVDMKQPLAGTPDGIEIELLPDSALETEPTLHQQPSLPERYGEVEIEAFVVAGSQPKEMSCLVSSRPSMPLDMLNSIDLEGSVNRLVEVFAGYN